MHGSRVRRERNVVAEVKKNGPNQEESLRGGRKKRSGINTPGTERSSDVEWTTLVLREELKNRSGSEGTDAEESTLWRDRPTYGC